ncbi:MAG: adenylate/guanylate cyclase domain-containing protein [Hormoscilla sp.]
MTDRLTGDAKKLPLRLILVVPFVVQIVGAVGLTGWLSWRNGQAAVNELVRQLMAEVAADVEQHVQTFADTPHLFLQINRVAIETGHLDLEDFPALERYFWHQIQLSEAVPYIYFGNERGEFIGVRQEPDGTTTLRIKDKSTAPNRNIYQLDRLGNRIDLINSFEYDPRPRPWYEAAVAAGKATWSPIYVFAASQTLGITPVMPIYKDTGELQGVLATDLTLSEISGFLKKLKISSSAEVFIIEQSGEIVASSASEPPFVITEAAAKRLTAGASVEPLIREAVGNLLARFESLNEIEAKAQFTFEIDGDRQFVQVTPFGDDRGLNWLMVVVIPEADFMEEINSNTRTTILLCMAALALAILLGLITSRWISKPIVQLIEAARAIASGQLDQSVAGSRVEELAILAESFNYMAGKMRSDFEQLAEYSHLQEEKVEERTQALEREIRDRQLMEEQLHSSESKMRAVFAAMTDIVLLLDTEGGMEVLPTNTALLYEPESDIIGQTIEQFFLDETAENWSEKIKRAVDTQQTITFDYSVPFDSGESWFAARISPMSENSVIWVARDITDRKRTELALRIAKQKSEALLLNILPKPIAEKLKISQDSLAESFDEATILFSDIVGFTPLSARMSPLELVNLLNQMFSTFDKLAQKYGLEKIKTIGDAYMVAGGLPIPRDDHAESVAQMALDMQEAIKQFQADLGEPFQIRIGINTGPVIAGVIGIKKFIYDLWGDTVNVASRMESSGLPGKIQVSAASYDILQDKFLFEERGPIAVKGKGEMITYWLTGRKPLPIVNC